MKDIQIEALTLINSIYVFSSPLKRMVYIILDYLNNIYI